MDLPVETLIGRGKFSACFSRGDHEWVPALPQVVMRDGFILLLTVFLSGLVAAAQTPTPQTVPAQERAAPIITRLQTVPVPSPARSLVLSENPGKRMQNVQLGPPAVGGLPNLGSPRQGYPGGPRSVRFYGLSLSFPFGRDAQIGRPTQTWRCFARFIRAPR